MRHVVDGGGFHVAGYAEHYGPLRFVGVYDDWSDREPTDPDEKRALLFEAASFSDAIKTIRDERKMAPSWSTSEMVARVIRERAMEAPYETPLDDARNDTYFAVSRGPSYAPERITAFAALGGMAVTPPHPMTINEAGVTPRLLEAEDAYPGVLALLLGGVVAYADAKGWLRGASEQATLTVKSREPSEGGVAAMQRIGFDHDTLAGEFRAPLAAARRAFATYVLF